jgi:nucleosome assembly protein 1-like 1
MDYQIGEDIKEKLIPRAVDWYTGKALKYEDMMDEYDDPFLVGEDEDDEDDNDDDDEDDDDDDDEDGVNNNLF